MNWDNTPKHIRDVFCCPLCQGELFRESIHLVCVSCGTRFPFLDRKVSCFAPTYYTTPQAKTERVNPEKMIQQPYMYLKVRNRLSGIRTRLNRYYLRDEPFWEAQLAKFRDIEERVVVALLDQFLTFPVALALELGVGYREKAKFYSQITKHVVCSDIFYDEKVAIRYASSSNMLYSVINVNQLPFLKNSFDLILTFHVVEHFPEKRKALKSIHNALKPDGWACHVVPTTPIHVIRHLRSLILNPLTLTPCILGGVHGEYDSILEELTSNTINSWHALFTANGFRVVADTPGKAFAMRPLSAATSQRIANAFRLYGSHVFLMRKQEE